MSELREDSMVRLYGEVCTKAQAGRILNCTSQTVSNMLKDGRLSYACRGQRVDVRSIARYIEEPSKADLIARLKKKRGGKCEPQFVV